MNKTHTIHGIFTIYHTLGLFWFMINAIPLHLIWIRNMGKVLKSTRKTNSNGTWFSHTEMEVKGTSSSKPPFFSCHDSIQAKAPKSLTRFFSNIPFASYLKSRTFFGKKKTTKQQNIHTSHHQATSFPGGSSSFSVRGFRFRKSQASTVKPFPNIDAPRSPLHRMENPRTFHPVGRDWDWTFAKKKNTRQNQESTGFPWDDGIFTD